MTDPQSSPDMASSGKEHNGSGRSLSEFGKRAGPAMVWQAVQHGADKLIDLARLLILAAILTPEDFGLLAVSLISVGLFTQLTELGLTPALVQRQSVEDGHYETAWTLGVLRGVVAAVLIASTAPWIADLLTEPRATELIRALAFVPLLQSLASVRTVDLARTLQFRQLAILRLSGALTGAIGAIALASSLGVWALVIGALAGHVVFAVLSYGLAPWRPRLRFDRAAWRSLIRFGRWVFLTGLIVAAGNAVSQGIISRRLGTVDLGIYYLAAKLVFSLADVGQQVISTVAFPLYARMQHAMADVARGYRSTLIAMAVLMMPVFAILFALAPAVTEILGAKWAGAEPLIRVLCLAAAVGSLGDVAVPLFNGLGRPSRVSMLEGVQSSLFVLGVITLIGPYGLTGATVAWLISVSASYVLALVFVLRLLNRPHVGVGVPLSCVFAGGIGAGVLAWMLQALFPGAVGGVVAGLLSLVAFWGGLWFCDGKWRLGLRTALSVIFPAVAPRD